MYPRVRPNRVVIGAWLPFRVEILMRIEACRFEATEGGIGEMVERYRRGKGKRKLLGSHQRCWIWGRNVVTETLRAGRWPIVELHVSDRLPSEELQIARSMAEAVETPMSVAASEALSRLCRSSEHQGYVAKMSPFPYDDLDGLLRRRPANPLYAVLDAVQDPHNFGALIRSAEVMAIDGVITGKRNQVEVTSLVTRSSAGAVNHVPLARTEDLPALLSRLKDLKIDVVGTDAHAAMSLFACDLSRPTALVIGNEGVGVTAELSTLCDRLVHIPQFGHVKSLNAAVAAGILFYEARRQRAAAEVKRVD